MRNQLSHAGFCLTIGLTMLLQSQTATAWLPPSDTSRHSRAVGVGVTVRTRTRTVSTRNPHHHHTCAGIPETPNKRTRIALSSAAPSIPEIAEFSDAEESILSDLLTKSDANGGDLKQVVVEALPKLPPGFILKIRQSSFHPEEPVRRVASELNQILEARMLEAKQTLEDLLNAGEIRKLDSLIGTNAKKGMLDAAFFNVLTMNLMAATKAGDAPVTDVEKGVAASRLQILQHIYTRCQEEVEKNIPAGTALLNKLLRTDQQSIRVNLYGYYLTPPKKTIESPDGKVIELSGTAAVLVPPIELVEAIGAAVKHIRTVEQAGAMDRESAAAMVESCRNVAKEARMTIAEYYGVESTELAAFEEGLQPVFRPASADSIYIQGE
jgi:hypothetical protein